MINNLISKVTTLDTQNINQNNQSQKPNHSQDVNLCHLITYITAVIADTDVTQLHGVMLLFVYVSATTLTD